MLNLVAIGLRIRAFRRILPRERNVARDPELWWVEPAHRCKMPGDATEWCVPRAEIDGLEIKRIGCSGDDQNFGNDAAQAPARAHTKRARTLLAHGVRSAETARAICARLLHRLGTEVPVVRAENGREYLAALRDGTKEPVTSATESLLGR